ncbi:MAG: putative LPS assembly protein LptD [Ferruginibacter sp.]
MANTFIFAATAMKNCHKGKAKYISAPVAMLLLVLLTAAVRPEVSFSAKFYKALTTDTVPGPLSDSTDTLKTFPVSKDSLRRKSLRGDKNITDSFPAKTDTFNVKMSKDSLDAPVVYHADDSLVMDVPGKKIILYGKGSNTKYHANELKAPVITFDQKTNIVSANFTKDSTGKVIASPTFKQDDLFTVSDSMQFNLKTGKGLTKGTYTQQGEMYVYGERIKKIDSTSFYALRSRITTCNLDTPHFAFVSKKIKFINQKFAVTGPVHPEFEGVPLPVYLPFGIYPMYQGRHSGLIAPTFTSSSQFGIGMERLGYYKVLSDYWDVTVYGTFYSYGGWNLNLAPRYYKRYRYQGNFAINIQRTKNNFKGDPDYSTVNTFFINWSHSADTKSRPGTTFSASVNAGSSKYNSNVQTNIQRNYNNIFGSSINYSKVWKDRPYNLSLVANHSQNTNLSQISVTLPTANFNLNTIYPFRRKEVVGAYKWYENFGIALNSNVLSQTVFYDDTARDKRPILTQITQNWKWGATHSVPISLSLPPLGPVQVSPGVSYSERWYQQKTTYAWDTLAKKVDTTIHKGFYSAREMSFSLGASTRIFGMFGFGKNSKIQAIRHEIRPNIGISYKPDMNGKYFKRVQVDTAGRITQYNVYQGNTSGAYGAGEFGGLSYSIDNVVQMKVRDKKDTSEGAVRKVTLIDGFSISGNYNFLADSFQFSPLSISFRTNLFEKINITGSASSNLYQVNSETGQPVNRLIWKDKPLSLGRLTNGQLSVQSSISGGSKNGNSGNTNNLATGSGKVLNPITGQFQTDYEAEAAYIRNNPAEFTDFSIPWSISYGYTLSFSKTFQTATKRFKTNYNSNVTFNGTLGLTEKWQIGMNTYYDITNKQLGLVTMTVAREMHCWQMAISISPIGRSRYFTITISPKSSLLRDLRINRSRYFFDQ